MGIERERKKERKKEHEHMNGFKIALFIGSLVVSAVGVLLLFRMWQLAVGWLLREGRTEAERDHPWELAPSTEPSEIHGLASGGGGFDTEPECGRAPPSVGGGNVEED